MKKPIFTSEAPAAIGPYSQGMRTGRFLFCSGQIPLDPKSGEIISGDIANQTRRVMDNIAALLRAGGLTFDHNESLVRQNLKTAAQYEFAFVFLRKNVAFA